MRRNKILPFILTVFLVLVMAVGCGPATPEPQETPQTPAPAPTPTPEPGPTAFRDGTHEAEGGKDERGWTPTIKITVANGEITEVDYEEVDEDGNPKSENEDYNERWEAQAGIDAPEAYEAYESQLIERQNVEEIEVVTGATSTFESFKALAQEALAKK